MSGSEDTTDHEDGGRPDPAENTIAAMRLRAAPPRVTRLSRKMLIGLGAVVLLGIGGALVYALQTKRPAHRSPELYDTGHATTSDEVQALPQDYTHVPKLGPPLPGDLGRPILASGGVPTAGPNIATETPDERRRQQEIEAARVSKLFARTRSQSQTVATASAAPVPAAQPDLAALGLAPKSTAHSRQDRQRAFLDAPTDRETVSPDRVQPPASPDILQAGTVIPAALVTGIRSDLPGPIIAQVTENVFDSPTGRILLVPQGTRLIGSYDNGVGFGQSRVLLVWTRMIFPNGSSITLERQPGADAQGYAGLKDRVDNHWGNVAKAAALSTLLGIGTELAGNSNGTLAQAIRDAAQNTVNNAGQQIVERQLSVAPTLTIRPGFPVRVIVTRDLVLKPYGG